MTTDQLIADTAAEEALENATKRLAYLHAADFYKSDRQGLYTATAMEKLIAETEREVAELSTALGLV